VENQRPTIAEIAAVAGVSIPTVSKVLNQRPDVAPMTRQRVEHAIAQCGYMHHRVARASLDGQTKRSKCIDLILPYALDSEYGLEILRGIEEVLNQTEYHLTIFSMHDKTPREQRWLKEVSNKLTDGALLFTAVDRTRHLEVLRKQRIPFVIIDDSLSYEPDTPSVGATNWVGGLVATEYLLSLGHRRIATITGIPSHLTSRARLAGYHAALVEKKIGSDPDLIRIGDFHHDGGYTQTRILLDLPNPPTAIFAASDLEATGVYRALYERGLNIPRDMSVIGFDDIPMAERMSPPLTTIRQPLKEMGRTATQMLLRMVQGSELENIRVDLATSLVIRASCASPTVK
jgi:LacI family transcriptional regulator